MMGQMLMLEAALKYAARGFPVFPCRGKRPRTAKGFHDATTDTATIRAWWAQWPNANIGIPTGRVSGLAVVDVDAEGLPQLANLERFHGRVPQTVTARTGGGGRHLIFRYREGFRTSAGVIARGIDTRGDGGYIIAPPSIHPTTGMPYEWEPQTVLAPLPNWLMPCRQAASVAPAKKQEADSDIVVAYRIPCRQVDESEAWIISEPTADPRWAMPSLAS
jgi:putative DNA primase/helicase